MVQSKYPDVLADLRRRIAVGDLVPGTRLPTWDELAISYGVGRPTLMRAMTELRDDGFVVSDSTRGSYVAPEPPCRRRIALVFGTGPDEQAQGGWTRFWQALEEEARLSAVRDGWDLVVYHRVDALHGSPGMTALEADIAAHRLAGVVMSPHGRLFHLVPRLAGRVPVVQVGSRYGAGETPSWSLDIAGQRQRCAALLRAAGATRVALLCTETSEPAAWRQALDDAGLGGEPWWQFTSFIAGERMTANLVRLICSQRPDGLVITDDNLVPGAVLGLREAGVRIGTDLHVAAHCNWPFPAERVEPLLHVGFDLGRMLREAVAAVRSGAPPGHVVMPAITAAELAPVPT